MVLCADALSSSILHHGIRTRDGVEFDNGASLLTAKGCRTAEESCIS